MRKTINVSDENDDIYQIKNVKIETNNMGWKVAEKDDKRYLSPDGRIYMEVRGE